MCESDRRAEGSWSALDDFEEFVASRPKVNAAMGALMSLTTKWMWLLCWRADLPAGVKLLGQLLSAGIEIRLLLMENTEDNLLAVVSSQHALWALISLGAGTLL